MLSDAVPMLRASDQGLEGSVWVVRGIKPSTTQCRVGTDVTRASYVFDVTVKPAARPKRR